MAVTFREPKAGFVKPAGFDRPAMMAIGDSLYNGMRSATIHARLARLSTPALVADALGLPFTVPDYPQPVLADLEAALRDLGSIFFAVTRLDSVRQSVRANLAAWDLPVHDGPRVFDNLAIAGAEVRDLLDVSAADADRALTDTLGTIDRTGDPLTWPLLTLHMAINARFLLNPRRDPHLDELRPIDHVAVRQPKRLLVSIGSNHGLIALSTQGAFDAGKASLTAYLAEVERLGEHLAALPPTVEHIYFNALCRPSAIANLMPVHVETWQPTPGLGKYYPEYENRLSAAYHRISAEDMREVDGFVADINRRVAEILATMVKQRLHIVDLGALINRLDGKHDRSQVVVVGSRTLTNNALEVDPSPWPLDERGGFRTGGLFSLDNHHLTTVGYAALAQQVIDTIHDNEKAGDDYTVVKPIRLDQVSDDLLDALPGIWALAPWLFLAYRRAEAGLNGGAAHSAGAAATEAQKQAVLTLLDVTNHVATKAPRTVAEPALVT